MISSWKAPPEAEAWRKQSSQTDQDIVENVLNSDDEGFLDLVEFHMFFSNLLPSMALLAGRRTGHGHGSFRPKLS